MPLRQVRLLGEYHRGFQASEDPDGQDIADPLYGNANGPEEKARAACFCSACIPRGTLAVLCGGSGLTCDALILECSQPSLAPFGEQQSGHCQLRGPRAGTLHGDDCIPACI